MSVTALLKWVTMKSRSVPSSTSVARGANYPHMAAWKAFITVGSFSFSRSNLILGMVGFFEILRRVWKVIITLSESESESELLLVTRSNDNHSPGPVMREVSP